MKRAALALTLLSAASALLSSSAVAQEFALKDGDRVVFYGDSITQDGRYANIVENYVATRFPEWNVTFVNAGVGGDKVNGGWAGAVDVRLERDVIAFKPTVVTIMLGMNDGGYKPFDQAGFDAYSTGYRRIVTRLKEALPGVRLTLILTSPYDDVTRAPQFPEGYNAVLKKYGAFVQELGKEQGALVVDLNTPLTTGIEKLIKIPMLARQIVPDRVHPGGAGHRVMAGALLRAWNAPAVVTRVELDASGNGARLQHAENADVAGLAAKGPYFEWTQTDKALPAPFGFRDAESELAELVGAGLEALDQQVLKITGLATGRYELLIDGVTVGKYGNAELLAGVNLAKEDTPMNKQVTSFQWVTPERHQLELVRRQLLVASASDPKLADTAATLASQIAKMQAERRTAAKPAVHRYEVRRSYALR
jgi:lysophospholipase L1-like esterase